jgi:hypothetical protein
MTDPAQSPLNVYLAWRAKLAAADQTRLDYLVVDALPLIADIIKSDVDPSIKQIAVVGGIADSVFDGAIDSTVAKMIPLMTARA